MDGYRIRDELKPHFVTFTVVDWDGSIVSLLEIWKSSRRNIFRKILLDYANRFAAMTNKRNEKNNGRFAFGIMEIIQKK